MRPSLDGQAAFFRNLGDGSNRLIVHFHETRAPIAHNSTIPSLQTLGEVRAFIDRGGAEALKAFNLSALPEDGLPIRLSHPAATYPSASPVGLTIEEYDSAMAQPLPLGGLDSPDRALRDGQAAWVTGFETDFIQVTQQVYDRNRRSQWHIVRLGVATAALAFAGALAAPLTGPATALALLAVPALAGPGLMITLVKWDHHHRGLALERFRAEVRIQAATIEAMTRRRQDNLVALIDGLFAAAGHLRDDSDPAELADRLKDHIRMIFALRTLLGGNRKCTRYHIRLLEMVREATALRLRDEALTRRKREANGYISHSYPRLRGRRLALLLAMPPIALAGALAIATMSWPAGLAAVAGIGATIAAWAILKRLNQGLDVLLTGADLAGLCDEYAFDHMPGPVDVPLETGFARIIDRWLKRLVREEDKQH